MSEKKERKRERKSEAGAQAKSNLSELEERIARLEAAVAKLIEFVEAQAQAQQAPRPQRPQAQNPIAGLAGLAQLATTLQPIIKLFGGGGEDPLAKLMRQALLEDLAFGRTLRRAVLRRLGKQALKDFVQTLKEVGAVEEAGEAEAAS